MRLKTNETHVGKTTEKQYHFNEKNGKSVPIHDIAEYAANYLEKNTWGKSSKQIDAEKRNKENHN